jgi:hypothetical protein
MQRDVEHHTGLRRWSESRWPHPGGFLESVPSEVSRRLSQVQVSQSQGEAHFSPFRSLSRYGILSKTTNSGINRFRLDSATKQSLFAAIVNDMAYAVFTTIMTTPPRAPSLDAILLLERARISQKRLRDPPFLGRSRNSTTESLLGDATQNILIPKRTFEGIVPVSPWN